MTRDEGTVAGGELLAALSGLEALHVELADVIERKIKVMRECNVKGMNDCTAAERDLVRRISEQEGRRRTTAERLARGYGMGPREARRLTVSELVPKLAPQQRAELIAVAERLSGLTSRIARRNQVAGRQSRQMLRHMDAVLSAMTSSPDGGGSYCSAGRRSDSPQRLFETVG